LKNTGRFFAHFVFGILFLSVNNLLAGPYTAEDLAQLKNRTLKDAELRKTLAQVERKDFIALSYGAAKQYLFGQIYLQRDDRGYFVKDVYCGREIHQADGVTIGPNAVPNQEVMNCEHTWPQSRFTGSHSKAAQKSDLHHLFPADSKANSVRGNIPFAEVSGNSAYDDCSESLVGDPMEMVSSSRYFEPPTEHKGNVARAIFYFAVKYDTQIDPLQESYLRQWNRLDPVDALERERNDKIMKVQGNRNPFVDFPELADRISDF